MALTVDDDRSGRLRSGESLAEAVRELEPLGIAALLLNCSTPEAIDAAWPHLGGASVPIGAYANAFTSIAGLVPGGTVAALEARTDLGPAAYAACAARWIEGGATIVGGCCETVPAHVRALAESSGPPARVAARRGADVRGSRMRDASGEPPVNPARASPLASGR